MDGINKQSIVSGPMLVYIGTAILSAHERTGHLPLAAAGHRHGRVGLPAVALAQRYDS